MKRKTRHLFNTIIIIIVVVSIISNVVLFCKITNSTKPKYETFEYSTLLPNVEDIDIDVIDKDGGDKYEFMILDVDDQYFFDYCSSLKNTFSDVRYEHQSAIGAYTHDGKYWAEAHYNDDYKNILVIVMKSRNYNE